MKITRNIEFDELWQFYLDAKFLYPDKLSALENQLEEIKETWIKLLKSNLDISYCTARKDDKGSITNSLAFVRYYDATWIVQHMVSNRNPKGMIEILSDSIYWAIQNPQVQFTKFYWRPNNRIPDMMFRGMENYLRAAPKCYHYDLFNYYRISLRDNNCINDIDSNFSSSFVVKEDNNKIREILKDNINSVILESDDLFNLNANLYETEEAYEANGLHRRRRFFVTRNKGKIVALSSAEDSSFGLNLSFYFNKVEIHYVNFELSNKQCLGLVSNILQTVKAYYEDSNRARVSITLICKVMHSYIFDSTRIKATKQYRCLTLKKSSEQIPVEIGGFSQAINFLQDFYNNKNKRIRNEVKSI